MLNNWNNLERKILTIAKPYLGTPEEWYERIGAHVDYREYSKGGLKINRGYYCPSLVYDIIVGGVSRGRIFKNSYTQSTPDYTFGFDANGKLLTVQSMHPSYEFIVTTDATSLGIKYYDGFKDLNRTTITYCEYDNSRLITYVNYSRLNNHLIDCWCELYNYHDKGLDTVDVLRPLLIDNRLQLLRTNYRFMHDRDGFLSSYKAIRYDVRGEIIPDQPFIYDIHCRRKI